MAGRGPRTGNSTSRPDWDKPQEELPVGDHRYLQIALLVIFESDRPVGAAVVATIDTEET